MADPVSFINWSLLALEPPGWGGVLLRGLLNSIEIAIGGYAFGLLLGIGGACGKLYGGPITRDLRRRMGTSWSPRCPVGLDGLRYVTVTFRGFDGRDHTGELVVDRKSVV